jgi:hypothetical protein
MLNTATALGTHEFDDLSVPYDGIMIGSFSGSFEYDQDAADIETIYIEGWLTGLSGKTIFSQKELTPSHPFYEPIRDELLRKHRPEVEVSDYRDAMRTISFVGVRAC